MALLFIALLALVPALALLLVPRAAFRGTAIGVAVLVVFAALWTWSFSNSCSSDGCIGIFLIGALTVLLALFGGIAGLVRRARFSAKDGDAVVVEDSE